MSHVELIKKFYHAFTNMDMATIHQLCDEQIEWNTLNGMPNGGKYVGLKAVFEDYFPKMLLNFDEFHATPNEFLESKDNVTVIGKYHGVSKKGKKFNVPFSHIYDLKENKIMKFRQYTDTQKIHESLI
ncbi:MAG: nuclear transport factor 2 family protein [Nitrosarchaeum sp.]